jgi:hypothetical protein
MKNITLYLINGKIISFMSIPDIDVNVATKDQLWIEGVSNPDTQYVENNQIINMPKKPNGAYKFDYKTKQWIENQDVAIAETIQKRNALLQQSDWTQIPNNPLTVEQQQKWAYYRQQLRDITSQSGYPFNVVWPTPPQ